MSAHDNTPHEGEVPTTGHEWDGIQEYNNPLPSWWLWTFYATIVWALVYTVLYPAWPMLSGATSGVLGYSSRLEVKGEIDRFNALNAPMDQALVAAELTEIGNEPDLKRYAELGGAAVFRTFCSQCHGQGAAGATGYPNLLDDDWLWGGDIEAVHQTIAHGIRDTTNDDTRFGDMPGFDYLEEAEVSALVQYVLSLSGATHDAARAEQGAPLFEENCSSCHGEDGGGNRDLGAPNLSDALWLYGPDPKVIAATIRNGRGGMMPSWNTRLTEAQIRQVAYYVHSLGGGE